MSEEAVVEEVVEVAVEAPVEAVAEEAVAETPVTTEAVSEDLAFTDTFMSKIESEELKGNKTLERLKGKNADELAQYITELASWNGKKGDIPSSEATEGEWNEFYTKMGRPETSDGYDFNISDDFKALVGEANAPMYEGMIEGFKEKAFELGMSEQNAAEIMEYYFNSAADDIAGIGETSAKQSAANQAVIDKEWGDGKAEIEGTMHAMLTKAGADVDALKASGILNDPNLAIALGRLAGDLADDPEIGHHMTRSVTGMHDQLGEVNAQVSGYISRGEAVPSHVKAKRAAIMEKLGDNI